MHPTTLIKNDLIWNKISKLFNYVISSYLQLLEDKKLVSTPNKVVILLLVFYTETTTYIMEQSADAHCPVWITIELLQKAVRSYKNDDSLKVENFAIKSGFSEHFASVMVQCKIDYRSVNSKHETLHVVIKAKPIAEGVERIECEGPMFENEIKMYTTTLPAFKRLFKRFGMNDDLTPE